jgi:hypothetical protein
LTKPDSVELEGAHEGHICRLGDKVRDKGVPRIRTKGSCIDLAAKCSFA